MFDRSWALNRFWGVAVFNPEFLEICEFVWPDGILPIVFLHVAFDWRCQIAKRICDARAWLELASRHDGQAFWKIENFMKY